MEIEAKGLMRKLHKWTMRSVEKVGMNSFSFISIFNHYSRPFKLSFFRQHVALSWHLIRFIFGSNIIYKVIIAAYCYRLSQNFQWSIKFRTVLNAAKLHDSKTKLWLKLSVDWTKTILAIRKMSVISQFPWQSPWQLWIVAYCFNWVLDKSDLQWVKNSLNVSMSR